MIREEFLKPCPFCGVDPAVRISYGNLGIACVNPKCLCRPSTWNAAPNTNDVQCVMRAWNRRRADPEPEEEREDK